MAKKHKIETKTNDEVLEDIKQQYMDVCASLYEYCDEKLMVAKEHMNKWSDEFDSKMGWDKKEHKQMKEDDKYKCPNCGPGMLDKSGNCTYCGKTSSKLKEEHKEDSHCLYCDCDCNDCDCVLGGCNKCGCDI